jgi:hypothetical protein
MMGWAVRPIEAPALLIVRRDRSTHDRASDHSWVPTLLFRIDIRHYQGSLRPPSSPLCLGS